MKGLSKPKYAQSIWLIDRATEEQLNGIIKYANIKLREIINDREQKGFDKFKKYEG